MPSSPRQVAPFPEDRLFELIPSPEFPDRPQQRVWGNGLSDLANGAPPPTHSSGRQRRHTTDGAVLVRNARRAAASALEADATPTPQTLHRVTQPEANRGAGLSAASSAAAALRPVEAAAGAAAAPSSAATLRRSSSYGSADKLPRRVMSASMQKRTIAAAAPAAAAPAAAAPAPPRPKKRVSFKIDDEAAEKLVAEIGAASQASAPAPSVLGNLSASTACSATFP